MIMMGEYAYCQNSSPLLICPYFFSITGFGVSDLVPHWFILQAWASHLLAAVVGSLSRSRLFATPWTTAHQAPLSTISQCLLKLMSIESMMPSNHLILCHPFSSCPESFPVSGAFPMSWLFESGGPSIGAPASVLPMHIQCWFPLG